MNFSTKEEKNEVKFPRRNRKGPSKKVKSSDLGNGTQDAETLEGEGA